MEIMCAHIFKCLEIPCIWKLLVYNHEFRPSLFVMLSRAVVQYYTLIHELCNLMQLLVQDGFCGKF
jgi:hypothetical protein